MLGPLAEQSRALKRSPRVNKFINKYMYVFNIYLDVQFIFPNYMGFNKTIVISGKGSRYMYVNNQ